MSHESNWRGQRAAVFEHEMDARRGRRRPKSSPLANLRISRSKRESLTVVLTATLPNGASWRSRALAQVEAHPDRRAARDGHGYCLAPRGLSRGSLTKPTTVEVCRRTAESPHWQSRLATADSMSKGALPTDFLDYLCAEWGVERDEARGLLRQFVLSYYEAPLAEPEPTASEATPSSEHENTSQSG